jgi:hypothetical protein
MVRVRECILPQNFIGAPPMDQAIIAQRATTMFQMETN